MQRVNDYLRAYTLAKEQQSRTEKSLVLSTDTAENHDSFFLIRDADHQFQSPCSAVRAQEVH